MMPLHSLRIKRAAKKTSTRHALLNAVAIHYFKCLTSLSRKHSRVFLMWIWTRTNAFKPRYQSDMADWGYEVLRCWHLLPFWLLLLLRAPSKTPFCPHLSELSRTRTLPNQKEFSSTETPTKSLQEVQKSLGGISRIESNGRNPDQSNQQ